MYTCSICGAKAEVKDGKVLRSCDHDSSPVVADMQASCKGVGGTKVK